ncbi:AI-2E family transporter [Parvibaculum sp.]|uniref:AI-2E family transporter n=1 Tax=Parvibaculum sp. TaxID=2024848 RepID=UPI002C360602|nr:AI-2E family transporter [Parvibaculum sp.]HUD52728.1 AI-2E family transporter [Parvibaculum sp.]
MSIQRQTAIWIGGVIVFALMLWLLKGILLPFVAGLAVAYFLDPFADRLEARGLSRLMATTVISVFFTVVVLAVAILFLPLLYQQTIAFIDVLPNIVTGARSALNDLSHGKLAHLIGSNSDVQKAVREVASGGLSWLLSLLPTLGSQGLALVGLISLIVVTPVVAFYMLLDWDRMVARLDELLPREHVETVRGLAREIDEVLAGFLRGQGLVCLFLGTFYAVGLSAAGLTFGLVVGIMTGILSFIPYLGTVTGFVVSVMLACFQFWPDFVSIGIVIGIFVAGQFIEGNFLQPKLIGDKIRLHPVWVMFALFAFSSLFGFVGALLAVPVAAAIGVLARFGVASYEHSRLYRGAEMPRPATAEAAGRDADEG